MSEKELSVIDTQEVKAVNPAASPMSVISMAIEQGTDVDQLTKLFELQERWEANEAKKAFVTAMAKFRSECPPIKRTKQVSYGQTSYKHAELSGAINQIKTLMKDCGLSHTWKTSQAGSVISVSCIVTHIQGHSESTTLSSDPDNSGGKNSIQAIGSAVSYLERYTLFSILGIASEDDDGKTADDIPVTTITETQGQKIEGMMADYDVEKSIFLKLAGINSIYDLPADQLNSAITWIKDQAPKSE